MLPSWACARPVLLLIVSSVGGFLGDLCGFLGVIVIGLIANMGEYALHNSRYSVVYADFINLQRMLYSLHDDTYGVGFLPLRGLYEPNSGRG